MIDILNNNKKAWIRIAEAAIAIILLASVVLLLVTRQVQRPDISAQMYQLEHTILEEISRNDSVRNAVLAGNEAPVRAFVNERLPVVFSFNISICNPTQTCEAEAGTEDVYSDDIIISASQQIYQPKKVKLYVWQHTRNLTAV